MLTELYTPDRLPGDEDNGEMSAWYLFSSLGFYPICPGKPHYTLARPLFDDIQLQLSGGQHFNITVEKTPDIDTATYTLNGREHLAGEITHTNLSGTLAIKIPLR